MQFRCYQSGDEGAQAEVYNTAARAFPKFKPATAADITRRVQDPDFDPETRFYAVEDGKVVAYALYNTNGRVSYPWCLPGHELTRDALFEKVLDAMKKRGYPAAFAAYRADWPEPLTYFQRKGFAQVREMVNFILPLADMPRLSLIGSDLSTPVEKAFFLYRSRNTEFDSLHAALVYGSNTSIKSRSACFINSAPFAS